MKLILIRSLVWAVAVVGLGAGIQRLPVVAAATPDAAALTLAVEPVPIATPRKASLTMLPTVYVVAHGAEIAAANKPVELTGVMAGDAVGKARTAIVGRVGRSAQVMGLLIPYYAFGGIAPRASE